MNRKTGWLIGMILVLSVMLLVFGYQYSYNKALDKISESEVESREDSTYYYIKNTNGFVTVYKGDGQTVYEYTSIAVENLPDSLIKQLDEGIRVSTPAQVYGFLENYSS